MVSEKKIIQVMDRYNLQKILLSPQIINSGTISYDWIKNIFPEIDLLKYKRKLKSFYKSNKRDNDLVEENQNISNLTKGNSKRFKFIYTTDMRSENIIKSLNDEFKQSKFSALKINNFLNTIDFNSNTFNSIMNFCKINSLPIFVFVYRKKECEQIYKLANENPSINFILASISGLDYFEYFMNIPSNLMCELSNLDLFSDYRLLKAINIFGAEKVLFSYEKSNEKDLGKYIKRILNLSIPDISKTLILSKNIDNLLSLGF